MVREIVLRLHCNEYGSVALTNQRLVRFSPLHGKSSTKPLGAHNRSTQMGNENGLIINHYDEPTELVIDIFPQLGTSLLRGVTTYETLRSCML